MLGGLRLRQKIIDRYSGCEAGVKSPGLVYEARMERGADFEIAVTLNKAPPLPVSILVGRLYRYANGACWG